MPFPSEASLEQHALFWLDQKDPVLRPLTQCGYSSCLYPFGSSQARNGKGKSRLVTIGHFLGIGAHADNSNRWPFEFRMKNILPFRYLATVSSTDYRAVLVFVN